MLSTDAWTDFRVLFWSCLKGSIPTSSFGTWAKVTDSRKSAILGLKSSGKCLLYDMI